MSNFETVEMQNVLRDALKLSESERSTLMAIALRHALFWSLGAMSIWYAIWTFVPNDEPAWAGLLGFAIVFALVFHLKRKSLLERVELILAETLRRHGIERQV
jgi:hypothetical protein